MERLASVCSCYRDRVYDAELDKMRELTCDDCDHIETCMMHGEVVTLRAELKTTQELLDEQITYERRSNAAICAQQYRALVECGEDELTPDAIEVRRLLLKDRADLEKVWVAIEAHCKECQQTFSYDNGVDLPCLNHETDNQCPFFAVAG